MKARTISTLLACSLLSATAFADEVAVEEEPAEEPATAVKAKHAIHFNAQAGVGTTFVARGVPQFADKSDMATYHQALLTFDDLGPGSLTVGYFHEGALTNPDKVGGPGGISPQLDPIAFYAVPFGKLRTSIGYFLHIWPAWMSEQHRDGMHEIQLTAAVEDWPVRPAIEIDVEFVRLHGVYANASLSKTFHRGDVSVTPSILAGVHGYDKPFATNFDLPFALREVTAGVNVTWKARAPFYFSLQGNWSYTGIKNWWMEDSFAGRSTPYAILSLGAAD